MIAGEQQAAQQQMMMEQMGNATAAAKNLSDSSLDGNNALGAILGGP